MKYTEVSRFGSCSQNSVAQLKVAAWQLQQSSYWQQTRKHRSSKVASALLKTKDKNVAGAKPGRMCSSTRQSVVCLVELHCEFCIWRCVTQAPGVLKCMANGVCQVTKNVVWVFQNRVSGVITNVFFAV